MLSNWFFNHLTWRKELATSWVHHQESRIQGYWKLKPSWALCKRQGQCYPEESVQTSGAVWGLLLWGEQMGESRGNAADKRYKGTLTFARPGATYFISQALLVEGQDKFWVIFQEGALCPHMLFCSSHSLCWPWCDGCAGPSCCVSTLPFGGNRKPGWRYRASVQVVTPRVRMYVIGLIILFIEAVIGEMLRSYMHSEVGKKHELGIFHCVSRQIGSAQLTGQGYSEWVHTAPAVGTVTHSDA